MALGSRWDWFGDMEQQAKRADFEPFKLAIQWHQIQQSTVKFSSDIIGLGWSWWRELSRMFLFWKKDLLLADGFFRVQFQPSSSVALESKKLFFRVHNKTDGSEQSPTSLECTSSRDLGEEAWEGRQWWKLFGGIVFKKIIFFEVDGWIWWPIRQKVSIILGRQKVSILTMYCRWCQYA